MLDKFIEELEEKKKNNQEVVVLDYVIKRLKEINVYWEVCNCEIQAALEDVCNDEVWGVYEKELDVIEKTSINYLTHKLYDYADFSDIYESARDEIIEEIGRLKGDKEND